MQEQEEMPLTNRPDEAPTEVVAMAQTISRAKMRRDEEYRRQLEREGGYAEGELSGKIGGHYHQVEDQGIPYCSP